MSNPFQFALNSAATAMNNADMLLRDIAIEIATDGLVDHHHLRAIVAIRRDLQKYSDMARAAAIDIKNRRVRDQFATGATSLREIA